MQLDTKNNGSLNNGSLDYYGFNREGQLQSIKHPEMPVTKVVFDESHGSLFSSSVTSEGNEGSHLEDLRSLLSEKKTLGFDCRIEPFLTDTSCVNEQDDSDTEHSNVPVSLSERLLSSDKPDILILAAPTHLFERYEIAAILSFVEAGGSLLLLSNRQSLETYEAYQEDDNEDKVSLNELMGLFGLRFSAVVGKPSNRIVKFKPHYLSSEINTCFFSDPTQIEILSNLPSELRYPPDIVAQLSDIDKPCIITTERVRGRIIAISDYIILEKSHLQYGSNQELVLNIFRWLARRNPLECHDLSAHTEVLLAETSDLSITISNPFGRRLEFISCLLESSPGVEILEPQEQIIRSLGPYKSESIEWNFKAHKVGTHDLKLSIDFLKTTKWKPLFFDQIVQLQCRPNLDIDIDLVIDNSYSDIPECLEVGKPVDVRAIFRTQKPFNSGLIPLRLESSLSHLKIELLETSSSHYAWRVTPEKSGNGGLFLIIEDTEQKKSRLIQVNPSTDDEIQALRKKIFEPLRDQILRMVNHLNSDIDLDIIQAIPFQICTADYLASSIYSAKTARELKDTIQALRTKKAMDSRTIQTFLGNITPVFVPAKGCYIPYEPELATYVVEQYEYYAKHVNNNMLSISADSIENLGQFDKARLEQNLAALILHEQYGHGLFFQQTLLGKQLTILYKHGFTRKADPRNMSAPYPRMLYTAYKEAICALWDSSVIVNEGFATWLELTILPLLSAQLGQGIHQRRDYLFEMDQHLAGLSERSSYFQIFTPAHASRYREGCELFQRIQAYFAAEDLVQVVVAAMMKATNIDMGIVEANGRLQFNLSPEQMEDALFYAEVADARSDQRLWKIEALLQDVADKHATTCLSSVWSGKSVSEFEALVNSEYGW